MEVLRLNNGRLGVEILPGAGAGMSRFTWSGRGEPLALMRTGDLTKKTPDGRLDTNQLACYPLVPWSNRIAEGGFAVDGHRIALSANRHDEPFPIHGSGWQRDWTPQTVSGHEALLVLDETTPDGWAYRASLRYLLRDDALHVELRVTNTGKTTMPFGLGLHPFFPCHGEATLLAPAAEVGITEGDSPLPVAFVEVPPGWDFRLDRALPDGLNHGFRAWNGDAVISWPRLGLHLHIETDVDAFVMYTPADEDFFCFEPVDHAINAVHLPGGPVANGMTLLAPQTGFARHVVFRVVDDTLASRSRPDQDNPA
jgi:aldose 1-epimerase